MNEGESRFPTSRLISKSVSYPQVISNSVDNQAITVVTELVRVPMNTQDRKIPSRLLLLMLVGLILRLGAVLYLGINKPPELGSDQHEYDTYAWNVAQGNGYRGMSPDVKDQNHLTAYRPPAISLAWAAIYTVVGHRYDAIRVLHCLASTLTIGLTFCLGRRLYGPVVGWLAAIGYTFFPSLFLYCWELLSEPLATLLFVAFLLACLDFIESPTWGRAIWGGILLGVGMLSRASILFMVPFTFVWFLWILRKDRKAILTMMAIFVVAGLIMLPWVVRNYYVFGKFIPFSTSGGSVLLQGNNRIVATDPELYGASVWDTEIPEYRDAIRAPNDEYERDAVAGRLARQWIRENPDTWLSLFPKKFLRAWTPFLRPHVKALYRVGTLVSWGPILLLFSLSFFPTLISSLRQGTPAWLLHLGIAHYLAISLLFYGLSRYRHPIEPLCMILAAVTVEYVWTKLAGREGTPTSGNDVLLTSKAGTDAP